MKRSAAVKFNKMIVLAALLLPGWLSAQEKIIEVQNQQDSYSIVRETRGGQWLVYNYNYGQCRFSLVDELQMFNNWGACAQQEIIESVKHETPKEPEEPQLRYESVSREMQVLRSYYMELPLKIKCE